MGSRVELFARIRRDARVEGLSIRELARRYEVGRPTVRLALSPPRKPRVRSAPRSEPFRVDLGAGTQTERRRITPPCPSP
jgi:hypothetical protein